MVDIVTGRGRGDIAKSADIEKVNIRKKADISSDLDLVKGANMVK